MRSDPQRRAFDVLIAEDDPDDLFLLMKAMDRVAPGLAVHASRDGIELCDAVDSLASQDWPRLILLDLNLPRRGGQEVLARLRQQKILVPTVVLTTSVERGDHESSLALGALEVLTKPDGFDSLLQLVAGVVDRHLHRPTGKAP